MTLLQKFAQLNDMIDSLLLLPIWFALYQNQFGKVIKQGFIIAVNVKPHPFAVIIDFFVIVYLLHGICKFTLTLFKYFSLAFSKNYENPKISITDKHRRQHFSATLKFEPVILPIFRPCICPNFVHGVIRADKAQQLVPRF